MQLHEPGQCPDPAYGRDCDGIGRWTINPYVEEIYGEIEWGWFCDGQYVGLREDI